MPANLDLKLIHFGVLDDNDRLLLQIAAERLSPASVCQSSTVGKYLKLLKVVSRWACIQMAERGCVEDQPQHVTSFNGLPS